MFLLIYITENIKTVLL